MGKGTGRWAVLVGASFLVHGALTVNSTETALWNAQGQHGTLLAQQLADAAAPLALARDMVSLSVLTARYESHPGIASLRIYNPLNERLSEAGQTNDEGRLFSAPMHLQQQALGQVDLRLVSPSSGDIVRASLGNIGVSALLHLLLLAGGLFLGQRETAAPRGARAHAPEGRPTPAEVPAPVTAAPSPIRARVGSYLHVALDDPNDLLRRVNAAMADELLTVFDQFIDRVARLYGGEVAMPFSPAGVTVCFSEGDEEDIAFRALAAAQLFLQLVDGAADERRACGRLVLSCKAGVLHETNDPAGSEKNIVDMLARTSPPGRILSSLPANPQLLPCRLSQSYRLAISETAAVQVAVIEAFAPEYQQLINNQSQHILAPVETA